MKLKALGFRVLIKPVVETKTDSGIVLVVDEKREKIAAEKGIIVDIGPTAWKAYDDGKPWAEVSDYVLYTRYGGKLVIDPTTAEEYICINDEDILCKIES